MPNNYFYRFNSSYGDYLKGPLLKGTLNDFFLEEIASTLTYESEIKFLVIR